MTLRQYLLAGLLASLLGSTSASAAVIGVVAPRSGPYALLGSQILDGARAAAQALGDTVVEIGESCEESGGAAVAKALVDAKAGMAIGFLCVETLTTALPLLKAHQIPAITVSVRSKILMEDALRNGWPLFRMAPVEGAEADKAASIILDIWKAEPIGLIDDGTIYGRELTAAMRQKLEAGGIAPVFTDTFRPGQEQQVALVRRLAKAGATHVFIGGDRNDIAIIARDAAGENSPLTLMGGDTMRAANRPVPLRDGVLAVALPDYAALPSAAAAANALRARNIEPDGYVLPAYAAVELAHQAISRATSAKTLPFASLTGDMFTTAIGPIAFDQGRELKQNPFALLEWRGNELAPLRPATD
ncbi:ABC transporter substrate-binding protein [Neorhizobium lilium]|uniref:ABC transporter substrate-binding protein n=1 Tax=Neorhizobium lilium TaxID=2503024 RepID=A0A444LCD6_9HYPH|nr:branched-chain amino acid ABC transporter substrate-binding protein [Neorhizobium lilium]RWX75468.1 ABC transporter substrate-binding protein [Neorhizobium lilium]